MKHYWMGQDLDDLPREKLVEIIVTLNRELDSTRKMALGSVRMMADVAKSATRRR